MDTFDVSISRTIYNVKKMLGWLTEGRSTPFPKGTLAHKRQIELEKSLKKLYEVRRLVRSN